MANIQSQKKRIRTNEKARLRNKDVKSSLKTVVASSVRRPMLVTLRLPPLSRAKPIGHWTSSEQGRHSPKPGGQPQVGHQQARRCSLSYRPPVDTTSFSRSNNFCSTSRA